MSRTLSIAMNLVWIGILVLAFFVSLGLLVVFEVAVIFFTRKRHRAIRYVLLAVPFVGLYFLWSAWLGPHEMRDPRELAARFELVFGVTAAPKVTGLHYQIDDGPDAMSELFRFETDTETLKRLVPALETVTKNEFHEFVHPGASPPSWWLSSQGFNGTAYYHGNVAAQPGVSPSFREFWIAHDENTRVVYCYIKSML